MSNAPRPAEPNASPHQGVGARIFRRIGGAVRNAIAGRPGRPPASRPSRTPPTQDPRSPAKRPRTPRQPRTTALVPRPARPGWFARWFGGKRPRPESPARGRRSDRDIGVFTPETHPGFAPEVCELLNTPVEECDPELLCLVFAVFARHLADSLPPELGLDAQALFSTLCDRLGPLPPELRPDAAPADPTPPVPEAAERAESDASSSIQTQDTPPAGDAAATTVASETRPGSACRTGSVFHPGRAPFARRQPSHRRRRWLIRGRAQFHRSVPDGQQPPPPRRRSCAAGAGTS